LDEGTDHGARPVFDDFKEERADEGNDDHTKRPYDNCAGVLEGDDTGQPVCRSNGHQADRDGECNE
jgi:hypothetical protein